MGLDAMPPEEMEPYGEPLARAGTGSCGPGRSPPTQHGAGAGCIVGLDLDNCQAADDARHAKTATREALIDYGVDAAKRGDDPIEAMWKRQSRRRLPSSPSSYASALSPPTFRMA